MLQCSGRLVLNQVKVLKCLKAHRLKAFKVLNRACHKWDPPIQECLNSLDYPLNLRQVKCQDLACLLHHSKGPCLLKLDQHQDSLDSPHKVKHQGSFQVNLVFHRNLECLRVNLVLHLLNWDSLA